MTDAPPGLWGIFSIPQILKGACPLISHHQSLPPTSHVLVSAGPEKPCDPDGKVVQAPP